MNVLRKTAWSPYAVGALIGALSWATFWTADEALGVSTTFVRVVGFVEQAVVPGHAADSAYLEKTGVSVDWQMALVVGIFLGALVSSRLSGDRRVEHVPELWAKRFGASRPLRYAAALGGGALLMFGARMAGGCTSGHGISGAMQLAVSSWTFLLTLFVVGVPAAMLLYGKEKSHV
jgi:hypothetical protein